MTETLRITDNRTGHSFEVPIEAGTIRATALREAKIGEDDFGLMSYDPAFLNTASRSRSSTATAAFLATAATPSRS
jgi:citrate synthase